MKSLVVDDDFFCRRILQNMLSSYGESHIAVNGSEALLAFESAHLESEPYDLICLDIIMPRINGLDVLKKIREYEEKNNILGRDQVKIIMTTVDDDKDSIISSFRQQCESYLIKPINKTKLKSILENFELV